MMILLGLYTGWRAVHSEYYLKGDSGSDSPTPATPLLSTPSPVDVEAPPQVQKEEKQEKAAAPCSRAVKWLRGLKERMLATVVGTVHGVAGACVWLGCVVGWLWFDLGGCMVGSVGCRVLRMVGCCSD